MLFLTEKDVKRALEGASAYREAVEVIERVMTQQSEGTTFHLKRYTMEHPHHRGHLWHNIRILPGMVPELGAAAVRGFLGYPGANKTGVVCFFCWSGMEKGGICFVYHFPWVRPGSPFVVCSK